MKHGEKAVPELTLTLAGEPRKLICSFGTFLRFEEETGHDGMDLDFWKTKAKNRDFCVLVWAAAGGKNSGLTVEQVADSLGQDHFTEIMELITKLFVRSDMTAEQKNGASPASEKAGENGGKVKTLAAA